MESVKIGIGGYVTADKCVFIDGNFLSKKLLEHWTKAAVECFLNGGRCSICSLNFASKNLETLDKCHVKDIVRGLILLGKYPEKSVMKEREKNDTI